METNLLDRMLNNFLADQVPVTVTLQNKIRVSGRIKAFDSYVIIIDNQKQEILYRHAVSSLASLVQEELKRPTVANRPTPVTERPAPKPVRSTPQKPRTTTPRPPAALAAPTSESGINNSMKDALLKWMQEQKAAK